MLKTTRTAAIASALTAGIAALALSAPLALAAPSPTPSSTSTPKATATSTPTGKPTKTPKATPTTTPTGEPTPTSTSKPVGKFTVSVTAPASTTGPAKVSVTGITSDEVIAEATQQGQSRVASAGSAWKFQNGAATFDVPAPKGGWVPGGYYLVKVTANGSKTLTEGFTAPGGKKGAGTLTPPSSSTAPAVVRIKGLTPGTKMSAYAGPDGTDGTPLSSTSGTVGKDGTITLSLPAPKGGWKYGQTYAVVVNQEGMGDHYYEATFTFRGGKGTGDNGGSTAGGSSKDSTGGLAKTGV